MLLSTIQTDKATLRDHLQSHYRQTGIKSGLLEPVDVPDEAKYIWHEFLEMNARRGSNGFGPSPISEEGVESFARRRGFSFSLWENRALDRFEQIYLRPKTDDDSEEEA